MDRPQIVVPSFYAGHGKKAKRVTNKENFPENYFINRPNCVKMVGFFKSTREGRLLLRRGYAFNYH